MATLKPDPTYYPSPRMAMQAPQEEFAYVVVLFAACTTLADLAGHDPHTKATVHHQLPLPGHRLRDGS